MAITSLLAGIAAGFTRVGTEFKTIRTIIGGAGDSDATALATTSKNLVGAINEVRTSAASAASTASAAAVISDTATATTTVWSSSKTNTAIGAAVAALVNSSPAALDTLKELSDALGGDAAFATTTATALGNRLKVDAAQTLTAAQIGYGQANLNVPDLTKVGSGYDTHDFSSDFAAAIAVS